MKDILESKFMTELRKITTYMYNHRWHEKNGGNISMLVAENELTEYLDLNEIIRQLPMPCAIPEMAGEYLVVTGTGKYIKNIYDNPQDTLGIVRVSEDGSYCELLWGFCDGGTFTSEITMHLRAHYERRLVNPMQKVIMHAHPTSVIAMTHVHDTDEKAFSKTLWKACTECICIFPKGVAVVPWMVSSSVGIGLASAERFKETNVVVWALHGVTVAGDSLDDAYGVLETVDKAAAIFLKTANLKQINTISDDGLKEIVETFNIDVKREYLYD